MIPTIAATETPTSAVMEKDITINLGILET